CEMLSGNDVIDVGFSAGHERDAAFIQGIKPIVVDIGLVYGNDAVRQKNLCKLRYFNRTAVVCNLNPSLRNPKKRDIFPRTNLWVQVTNLNPQEDFRAKALSYGQRLCSADLQVCIKFAMMGNPPIIP
ncbi:MAG: hypothetical protein HY884_09560, partial [Deltaproteobacteria bacterium]|nr:hypothetical protein [Deltaproteobacteria bacterium]